MQDVYKTARGWSDVEKELHSSGQELKWMQSKTKAQIHIKAANHPEHLLRHVNALKWDSAAISPSSARLFLDRLRRPEAPRPRNDPRRP